LVAGAASAAAVFFFSVAFTVCRHCGQGALDDAADVRLFDVLLEGGVVDIQRPPSRSTQSVDQAVSSPRWTSALLARSWREAGLRQRGGQGHRVATASAAPISSSGSRRRVLEPRRGQIFAFMRPLPSGAAAAARSPFHSASA
jgi:hypothetical protein